MGLQFILNVQSKKVCPTYTAYVLVPFATQFAVYCGYVILVEKYWCRQIYIYVIKILYQYGQ